jgi:glycosyltransferase involved in cell wall biosynthesis
MISFSVIVPVYNRPQELDELLESLCHQTYTNFDVLIIDDGSENKADVIVEKYDHRLRLSYFYKPNTGQGFSRNFGFERARGDYFIVFDSDCLIPPHYFSVVSEYLTNNPLDAYGGPDRAHPDFTLMQKAISYSMTSIFTTGGIRGNKKQAASFEPRSFNMGISKEVYQKTGGYKITRMGEDIEFSIRIKKNGFSTGLIEEAFVYHKRRTSLKQFYRQLHFFGRARINVGRFFPERIKNVHRLPALFTIGVLLLPIVFLFSTTLFLAGTAILLTFFLLIFLDAWKSTGELPVAIMAIATSFTQLFAYGIGFITEGFKKE